MKQQIVITLISGLVAVNSAMGEPAIIPAPQKMVAGEGVFKLAATTRICAEAAHRSSAEYLAAQLRRVTAFPLEVLQAKPDADDILITGSGANSGLGAEGYELDVTPQAAIIKATATVGSFYGVQTLLQLLPPQALGRNKAVDSDAWEIPAVRISDQPRFKWRGMMLDCGRHLFPLSDLKQMIDAMALIKLNTFHWHLTDDQGWRIEIKKYPKLTEVGAWRRSTPPYGNRLSDDNQRYGGFYTQAEIKELVAYAATRHITIVPEIELPGHAAAAIASYPDLGNTDLPSYQPEVKTRWGVHDYVFAPKEETFEFLENVFAEVCELFPSKYIHIGGDEAPKDQWHKSKFAQEVIKREGLKDEHELQSWFIRRVEKMLAAKRRSLIGWDEIQEGGLSKTATMMVWRDPKWAKHALQLGNDVVMATHSDTYFDYYQSDSQKELAKGLSFEAIGGHLELAKAYSYNPTFVASSPEHERQILGTQFQLWSEYIKDIKKVHYMTFPRGVAMSEVAWTQLPNKNYNDFLRRLRVHLQRFDVMGIGYRVPEELGGN